MESGKLTRQRGEVIERFINIEVIVNTIICQHYFGKVRLDFLLEVLCDEYFSFGLKCNLLKKITADTDAGASQDLRRAGRIRNCFAHSGMVVADAPEAGAAKRMVDSRRPEEAVDFDKLCDEFMVIAGRVETYLCEVYRGKGGQMVRDDQAL